MSEEMKVKDLATELGVSTKDLLRVLREMDIPAKSTVSSVPEADLPRIKSHFSAQSDDARRREVQPGGVIVRRKRVQQDEAVAQEPAETVAPEQSGESRETVAQVASASAAPSAPVAARPVETPNAKIITPKGAEEGEARVAPVVSHDTVDTEAVRSAPHAEQPAAEPQQPLSPAASAAAPVSTVQDTPAAPAAPEQTATHEPPEGNRRGKRRPAPRVETVAAKVISRPDSTPAAPATPVVSEMASGVEQLAPQATGSATNDAVAVGELAPAASEQAAEAAQAGAETAESVKHDAPLSEAEQAKVKADQAAKAARRAQASASARPEGSSAPSLLPPVSEARHGETDEEGRARRAPRRPQESTPQVRIISRPEAQPARVVSEAPRDGRDGQAPRGPRPGGYAPGGQRPYTPGGPGGQRPGGGPGGPGGPRPAGPGGPRPAGPGGPGGPRYGAPAPGMPGAAPGGEHEGQSKKKRNKTRKTNDFAQTDMTFGRRRDDEDSDMPRSRGRRRSKPQQRQAPTTTQPLKAAKRKIRVEEAIRVADMAHQMGLKSSEIIKVLFNLGIMATINKALDLDTATVVAAEFGYEVEKSGFAEEDYLVTAEADAPESLKRRPPVVTIMGHVDHGKTSLLDAIRKTNVTSGEAGGITQHIGAYHVSTKSGEIVFLDTPGHEAFTAMRARGAQVTDLVVLVVAADDGVMEQTREAANHAKAAGVPIMVAVNKIDKPEANPDRVLRELSEIGLVAEDWGGETVVSKVSAKSREGLDEMLELLALQADILELTANPDKPARGHIVEAKLDKGRGPVATVLIQDGTLTQGDTFVCGVFSGKVRAMFNDQGRKVKEAGPSMPVEVQGFEGVPEAGEEFICLPDEKLARRIAESRAIKQRERELAKESRVTLETFLARNPDDKDAQTLNLVVKADVQGSQEAIIEALNKQSTDKVRIQIIHGGTGAITESDILLASASDAIVIGFNVRPTAKVKEVAEHENVDIRFYDIIYKLVDEIKSAMAGLLAPVSREVYLGQADVREVFSVPKVGTIAGSHVSDGKMLRNAGVRLLRNGVVVHTGKIGSLRRFKDDVREVLKGYECGVGLENFNDVKVGDVIEAFEMVEEAATL